MTPMGKGLLVAAAQLAIVASLGAKLTMDRAHYPRVWARAAPVDPGLPIRGRYVSLRLEAAIGSGLVLSLPEAPRLELPGPPHLTLDWSQPITLAVKNDALVASSSDQPTGVLARGRMHDGQLVAELVEPAAYFIPEGAPDPSVRAIGEELWVEVTVPPHGPPRPIRLGVKKDGVLTPLDLR